ncbi:SDR family oxidoreductase [Rhodococcus wratislaviensis]|uniref:SDR family oxidoreductase n=1 Tax=Rhodococcus wratislaviensis TaxID=44752 RepID=UPI0036697B5C
MTEHEKFTARRMLADKAVLISGAASGIGRATAERAAASGASVMVTDIDPDLGAETVATVRSSAASPSSCVLTRHRRIKWRTPSEPPSMPLTVSTVPTNNAGFPGPAVTLVEYQETDWNRLLSVNLTGVFLAMRAQIEVMLEQGSGSIVNTASVAGVVGIPNLSAYAATKHGVIGLTKAVALEVAKSGIRVNAVCPGSVETPLVHKAGALPGSARREAAEQRQPMGHLAEPEEIAEAVVWLLSDKASVVTGHPLVVDGGYVAQ